jgi:hypothetical protein
LVQQNRMPYQGRLSTTEPIVSSPGEHEPRRSAPFPNGDVTTVSQVGAPLGGRH